MPVDDGWPPIGDHAVIGDGRTVALVARDGAVNWLCLPDLDSPSVFAALLDRRRGGRFVVAPDVPYEVHRRYLPGTNVLESTYHTRDGTARVTEALTLPTGLAPQRELVRRVEGLGGSVPFVWSVEPRFGYGGHRTRIERRMGIPVATGRGIAISVCAWDAGEPRTADGTISGSFTTRDGASSLVVMAAADGQPLVLPSRKDSEQRLDATTAFWEEWANDRTYDGPWKQHVIRSVLILKLLVFSPSGALAAAPTTSLPEHIGGDRNYDYRFVWLRDAAFTVGALLQTGCSPEADSFFWWLTHATRLTHPRLDVLYRLDGRPGPKEEELPLEGYRGSSPVRIGNDAAHQLQLDTYGDLLHMAGLYVDGDRDIDRDSAKRLAEIADLTCRIWEQPESGIWEDRERRLHFTQGKMNCAVALERACELAERGVLPGDEQRVARWRRESTSIRRFVDTRCWSEELQCYREAADSEELDAAVLLGAINRYVGDDTARMSATIDTLRRRLGSGPFLHRTTVNRDEEGAFLACSFWLVDALARLGRVEEAAATMDELVGYANDVGLFSEQIDPHTGSLLGNFPQALTHLALVNAATSVAEATR
ncbi:MAG TPA: glycoside hydrolase family 15 protein [Actinomycetota bacterium]|nr:glycoside hydrolase family 15 protein [Actinomycetota bacterium]